MKKNKLFWIIIVAAVFLIIGIVEIVFFSQKDKVKIVEAKEVENHYHFSSVIEEAKGTQVYTSPTLNTSHCLDSVCVEKVTFYYTENGGRIEYTLLNQSKEEVTGLLKMVFGNQSLIIAYQDLVPGVEVQTSSYYSGKSIENMEDYRLEQLTAEEKSKIVYSK